MSLFLSMYEVKKLRFPKLINLHLANPRELFKSNIKSFRSPFAHLYVHLAKSKNEHWSAIFIVVMPPAGEIFQQNRGCHKIVQNFVHIVLFAPK